MKANNKIKFALNITMFLFIISSFLLANKLNAQTVKIALSEQSTTIKKYVYTYVLSSTEEKKIRYIVVIDANGDLKTCFDACYVCYQYDKGYTQKTTQLVCNNCGNKFTISNLDSEDTGGCYPVYLSHKIDGDSISINVDDLQAGAYLFPIVKVSDVSELTENCGKVDSSPAIVCGQTEIKILCESPENRNFQIIDIDGKVCKSFSSNLAEIVIDAKELPAGAYILSFKEDGNLFSKLFYLNK